MKKTLIQKLQEAFDFTDMTTNEDNDFSLTNSHALVTVHENDRELMEYLDIKKYNAIVAGGAALCWYQNQPVKYHDIDLWFKTREDAKIMSNYLSARQSPTFTTDNADTFEIQHNSNRYRVQVIKRHVYDSIDDLLDEFDITVCKVATDGNYWWLGKNFVVDLKDRRLSLTSSKPAIVRRMIKYMVYGYTPEDTTLQQIIDNPLVKWDYTNANNADEYDAIS